MGDSSNNLDWHIAWDDGFRTGVPAIDAEHRAFIDLVNEMNARIQSGDPCSAVRPIVNALIRDTVTHFAHEERLLRQLQVRDRSTHFGTHNAILDRLTQLARRLVEETPEAARIQIGLTIRDLLIRHIREEDREFSAADQG